VDSDQRLILLLAGNAGRGGMQTQIRLLASALHQQGATVAIAMGPGDFAPLEGVALYRLPAWSRRHPWKFLRATRRLVRKVDPGVIHGHGLRMALILRTLSAPVRVVTCHGIDPRRARASIYRTRLTKIPVVACGTGPQDLLARYGLESTVINNIAPAPGETHRREELLALLPEATGRIVALYPARFSEQKNHRGLLSALRAAREELGTLTPLIWCVGDGPLRDEIERDAASDEFPLLRLTPYLPDAASWFSATDFFILPSRWEGQPTVILEAVRAGVPVLTSTPTGVDDLCTGAWAQQVAPAELSRALVRWARGGAPHVQASATRDFLAAHESSLSAQQHLRLYGNLGGHEGNISSSLAN
jgi:glycosyltransferase involved in cell wall biosynthesis